MIEEFRALFAPGGIGPRLATVGFAVSFLVGAALGLAHRVGVI